MGATLGFQNVCKVAEDALDRHGRILCNVVVQRTSHLVSVHSLVIGKQRNDVPVTLLLPTRRRQKIFATALEHTIRGISDHKSRHEVQPAVSVMHPSFHYGLLNLGVVPEEAQNSQQELINGLILDLILLRGLLLSFLLRSRGSCVVRIQRWLLNGESSEHVGDFGTTDRLILIAASRCWWCQYLQHRLKYSNEIPMRCLRSMPSRRSRQLGKNGTSLFTKRNDCP